jgi:hypothetical protein
MDFNLNKKPIKVLKKKISAFKEKEGLTWKNMQTPSFKSTFALPCSWNALYKIVQKQGEGVHPNTIKALLDHFKVPSKQTFNKITLL